MKILTESLPSGEKGKPYQAFIEVTGGLPPYVYSIAEGVLPPGLNIDNSNGLISGKPESAGRFSVKTAVVDASIPAQKASKTYEILVMDVGASTLKLNVKAGPTKGVAPLSVFFDATGTTSRELSKPFHHLLYEWDFADPGSRRPKATGPMAVHVFEKPGTYKVAISVENPKGEVVKSTQQITVEDPDKVFAGANTICFSNNGDFTGAPSGAKKVKTNDFRFAMTFVGNGKRLLFKRGDTYQVSDICSLKGSGPCILGAYGKGNSPDERGIFANNPVIRTVGGKKERIFDLYGSDLRIMDLDFVTDSSSQTAWTGAVNGARKITRILLLRLKTGNFQGVPLAFADDVIQYFKDEPFDRITLADCHVGTPGVNSVYMGGTRIGILGNLFENSPSSHVVRLTFLQKGVIEGNVFHHSNPHRHLIKLHSREYSKYPLYSEKILISGNEFHGNSDWPIALGPQNAGKDERVRDVIIEKNTFFLESTVQVVVFGAAGDLTMRNNVFVDGLPGGWSVSLVSLGRRGIEPPPWGGEIYNNTFFSKKCAVSRVFIADLGENQTEPVIFNNLLYSPTAKSGTFHTVNLLKQGQTYKASGNFMGKDPLFTDPSRLDFSLKTGSPAVDYGAAPPVTALEDIRGRHRPMGAAPDAGAFESH